ncbi:hypothetical protein ACTZWW_05845 [Salinarimonas sp. NSM]|uniref:hypothetical protein n=1 Tax=Salinarimonas sp. NSM TaxID=3458003 RepID=UPI0040372F45
MMLPLVHRVMRSSGGETGGETDVGPPRPSAAIRANVAAGRDLHRERKDALIQRVEAALRDANDRHHLFKLDGHAR